MQAAVGVLLGDRDHETEVGFHHLLLGLAGFALALLHGVHDLAELDDLEAGQRRELMHLVAEVLDAVLLVMDEILPALGRKLRDAVEPARIELRAGVVAQEVLARDAVAVGKAHQAALMRDEALVDVVELLDE